MIMDTDIKTINLSLSNVELEIKEISEQINSCSNLEERKQLREDKRQLREKEILLLKERQRKEIALDAQQPGNFAELSLQILSS